MAAYADYLLLLVTNLGISLQNKLKQLQVYSSLLNYKTASQLLAQTKEDGGIGFPDPLLYWKAIQMSKVMDLCQHGHHKSWFSIQQSIYKFPLPFPPWLKWAPTTAVSTLPLFEPMIHVMRGLIRGQKTHVLISGMSLVIENPYFKPGLPDPSFKPLSPPLFSFCNRSQI